MRSCLRGYHKPAINKLPILAAAPTDFHVKNLIADIRRKVSENWVSGAWINSKGSLGSDGFILLKLAKEMNLLHVGIDCAVEEEGKP